MNSRKLFSIAALLLANSISFYSFAQDENDALRLSLLSPMGTARSMGFGSALGSVGGDFTSLSVNPAGIGVYRRSEIMFTPGLKFSANTSTYQDEIDDQSATRINFNNLGVVFTRAERGRDYESRKWKTISFGVGLNRLADFTRSYNYSGTVANNLSSNTGPRGFSELFITDAINNPGSIDQDGTLASLGYDSYLLNQDSAGYYLVTDGSPFLNQRKSVQEKGGVNEWVISVGGNYEEKLMIGATLGLPSVRYIREMTFDETDPATSGNTWFESMRYKEKLQTTGMGVNLKLGMILKPSDQFRIGVAFHTPTWYNLTDVTSSSLTTNTENFKADIGEPVTDPITSVSAPDNEYQYGITTPWRAVVSMTAFLGQFGFVSADYEYVDYKSMRIRFDGDNDAEDVRNDYIRENFKGASNLRLGFEARLDEFFGRAGYGYYGNPYENGSFSRSDLSIGIGYRSGDFFTDLAFVHSMMTNTEQPYVLPAPIAVPTAKLDNKLNTIAWTIGWKF